jgi:hypothetical protein
MEKYSPQATPMATVRIWGAVWMVEVVGAVGTEKENIPVQWQSAELCNLVGG